jgi:hypothetical protein
MPVRSADFRRARLFLRGTRDTLLRNSDNHTCGRIPGDAESTASDGAEGLTEERPERAARRRSGVQTVVYFFRADNQALPDDRRASARRPMIAASPAITSDVVNGSGTGFTAVMTRT